MEESTIIDKTSKTWVRLSLPFYQKLVNWNILPPPDNFLSTTIDPPLSTEIFFSKSDFFSNFLYMSTQAPLDSSWLRSRLKILHNTNLHKKNIDFSLNLLGSKIEIFHYTRVFLLSCLKLRNSHVQKCFYHVQISRSLRILIFYHLQKILRCFISRPIQCMRSRSLNDYYVQMVTCFRSSVYM